MFNGEAPCTYWKFAILIMRRTLFRKETIQKFGVLLKVYYEAIFMKQWRDKWYFPVV